jgi:hypothetical protein
MDTNTVLVGIHELLLNREDVVRQRKILSEAEARLHELENKFSWALVLLEENAPKNADDKFEQINSL